MPSAGKGLESGLRAALAGRRVVVLGVGNPLRGDDGFGPAVIERLRADCGAVPGSGFLVPSSTTRNQPLDNARGREPVEREPGTRNCPAFLNAESAPENFAGKIRGEQPEVLLVLDAADFGGSSGELRLLVPGDLVAGGISSHSGSLTMLFDYLRAECGTQGSVLAVQAGAVRRGEGLSAPVDAAVERAAKLVGEALVEAAQGDGHA